MRATRALLLVALLGTGPLQACADSGAAAPGDEANGSTAQCAASLDALGAALWDEATSGVAPSEARDHFLVTEPEFAEVIETTDENMSSGIKTYAEAEKSFDSWWKAFVENKATPYKDCQSCGVLVDIEPVEVGELEFVFEPTIRAECQEPHPLPGKCRGVGGPTSFVKIEGCWKVFAGAT